MLAYVVLPSALLLGDWGAAGCGPVGSPQEVWKQFACDPGRSYLFRDGVQAAGYDHEQRIYRAYDARTGVWGSPEPPPWENTSAARAAPANFGVDLDKLNGEPAECYRINGKPASRDRAFQALADQRLPDDAGRLRLTIIGPDDLTTRVSDDLKSAKALADWRDRLAVQAYAPDHWAVARTGFVTSGQPTIYVQTPDGQVLHRQDDYADGPEGLARALRRADPRYDARKDPDLRKRLLFPKLDLSSVPMPVWILAAGFGWLLVRRRGNQ